MDGSESGTSGGSNKEENVESVEPLIQFVIGPDGLREFLIPLVWTINDFNSSIKRPHFETLRERYQISTNVRIRLPFKFKKCYYWDVEDIGVYE